MLTAWFLWRDPSLADRPKIYKVANIDAPCAPFTAGFTSGLRRDPNEFIYTSPTESRLKVRLNFNPTFPGEGALTRKVPCFQKDVPGIEDTALKQFTLPRAGDISFVLTSSDNPLGKYNPKTGYEILDAKRRPEVVRSPDKAFILEVVNHLDNTTHGISPGATMVDHYTIMIFPIAEVHIGSRTVSYN